MKYGILGTGTTGIRGIGVTGILGMPWILTACPTACPRGEVGRASSSESLVSIWIPSNSSPEGDAGVGVLGLISIGLGYVSGRFSA